MSLQQDILNLKRKVNSIEHKLCSTSCCNAVLPDPFILFTQNSDTIELTGAGTDTDPLIANVIGGGGGSGDNWGIQVVETDDSIDGDGTILDPLITRSWHGGTALVSKSGNDVSAASAFSTINTVIAWDWNKPFLTLSAAHAAIVSGTSMKVEDGIYGNLTTTKPITINADRNVTLGQILTGSNCTLKISGKPDVIGTSNEAIRIEHSESYLDLGKITGVAGISYKTNNNKTSYLNADSISIDTTSFISNASFWIGSSSTSANVYANIDYIRMNQNIGDLTQAAEVCAIYAKNALTNVYINSKVIESNTDYSGNFFGLLHGTVTSMDRAKLHIKADLIRNTGSGRAISITNSGVSLPTYLYLDVNEIRVATTTSEAGSMEDHSHLYFKSGCRVISGTGTTYAIVGNGTGDMNIFIDGEVYSNKPLDPLITLVTGSWIVDPSIV